MRDALRDAGTRVQEVVVVLSDDNWAKEAARILDS